MLGKPSNNNRASSLGPEGAFFSTLQPARGWVKSRNHPQLAEGKIRLRFFRRGTLKGPPEKRWKEI